MDIIFIKILLTLLLTAFSVLIIIGWYLMISPRAKRKVEAIGYWLTNPPVYRVDVLNAVKENYDSYSGLCLAIAREMDKLIPYSETTSITDDIPLHKRKNALPFGASTTSVYWWEEDSWDTGRMEYLDWLIEQYKDDKTNLLNPFNIPYD